MPRRLTVSLSKSNSISTTGSLPTTQPSWPGSMATISGALYSVEHPSPYSMWSRPARESRRARACNGPCRRSASCRPTSEIRPDRSCASRELPRRVRPRVGHGRSAAARLLSCRRGAHRVPSLDLEQCDAFSKPHRTSYWSSAFSSPWAVCPPEALLEPIILSSRKTNKVGASQGPAAPPSSVKERAAPALDTQVHVEYRADRERLLASSRASGILPTTFRIAVLLHRKRRRGRCRTAS